MAVVGCGLELNTAAVIPIISLFFLLMLLVYRKTKAAGNNKTATMQMR